MKSYLQERIAEIVSEKEQTVLITIKSIDNNCKGNFMSVPRQITRSRLSSSSIILSIFRRLEMTINLSFRYCNCSMALHPNRLQPYVATGQLAGNTDVCTFVFS